MILSKKKEKKTAVEKNCRQFFLAYIFFIFLKSSETYYDLVASKIRAKLINFVIYGDILVNFLEF